MIEQEARQLAKWLEGERSQRLDGNVHEAVFVLRPDLAPLPRVSIDDILSSVESGPFATNEKAETPEEDRVFVESVFSTFEAQPSLSIDDILGTVEQGPLREEGKEGKVVALRAWWKHPGVGLVAAAAMALIVLIPSQFTAPTYEDSHSVEAAFQEAPVSKEQEKAVKNEAVRESSKEKLYEEAEEEMRDPAPSVSQKPKPNRAKKRKSSIAPSIEKSAPAPPPLTENAPNTETPALGFVEKEESPLDFAAPTEDVDDVLLPETTSGIADSVADNKDFTEADELQILETKEKAKRDRRWQREKEMTKDLESEMAEPMSASEESLSLRQQADWFGDLQNQLSREQRSSITETADFDSIIAMSKQASNTQALDILWQASQYKSGNEAIQLLQKSTQFSSGDRRYLARNYLRLGDLYEQAGRLDQAEYFYRKSIDLR